MKGIRARSAAVTLAFCVLAVVFAAQGAEFVHGPYSGAPTEESVVISWSTPASVPAGARISDG